jgi:hypothetical protein
MQEEARLALMRIDINVINATRVEGRLPPLAVIACKGTAFGLLIVLLIVIVLPNVANFYPRRARANERRASFARQVTFPDNTLLTLGESACVAIDRYVFDPNQGIGEAC